MESHVSSHRNVLVGVVIICSILDILAVIFSHMQQCEIIAHICIVVSRSTEHVCAYIYQVWNICISYFTSSRELKFLVIWGFLFIRVCR